MQVISKKESDRLKKQMNNMTDKEKEEWNKSLDIVINDLIKEGYNIKVVKNGLQKNDR